MTEFQARVSTCYLDASVVEQLDDEIASSTEKWGSKYHSLHEAWAVIGEELHEVEEIMWQKRQQRDPVKLRHELIQVASSAIKAIRSMENFVGEHRNFVDESKNK